jgi:hypothetical protein
MEAGADNPGGKELVRQESASESRGEMPSLVSEDLAYRHLVFILLSF